ncbi:hypothetical protein K9U39_17635 [Rhodoblastus acidophilus]|uniref:Uncharacterized protein n=1 Tax=Candidatus Rhodoblastus alkanivorans TaxID=2954117 RepID=A0ABS9Z242_9HYPH|nr:hypothetical protein [Candidatus Rhodoblastus alkanivorans]MCI4679057.1 hypothetical protein [Candidatus Rhodoblastus alkanivorans]MCI4681688.1 hypothetical protein [Candidatus Rhodoblastus alkanivorans]MDI4642736.1 hypothetical protein [Rhodoblastus acidophilus]
MADYFTQFSCLLDVGAPENAARALELYEADCADGAMEAKFSNGFFVSVPSQDSGNQLWIRDEGAGDPESVIRFVKICASEFSLSGHWGFQYSNMCSKPRLDGFGGGAHVLDLATGETIAWIDTEGWMAQTIADAGDKP